MRKQKGIYIANAALATLALAALVYATMRWVGVIDKTIVKYQEPKETLDLAVRFDSFGVSNITSEGKKKVITATSGDKFTVNWDDDIENMTSFEVRTMPAGNKVLCAYQKCAEVL